MNGILRGVRREEEDDPLSELIMEEIQKGRSHLSTSEADDRRHRNPNPNLGSSHASKSPPPSSAIPRACPVHLAREPARPHHRVRRF